MTDGQQTKSDRKTSPCEQGWAEKVAKWYDNSKQTWFREHHASTDVCESSPRHGVNINMTRELCRHHGLATLHHTVVVKGVHLCGAGTRGDGRDSHCTFITKGIPWVWASRVIGMMVVIFAVLHKSSTRHSMFRSKVGFVVDIFHGVDMVVVWWVHTGTAGHAVWMLVRVLYNHHCLRQVRGNNSYKTNVMILG